MYYIECLDFIKSSGPVSLLVITTQRHCDYSSTWIKKPMLYWVTCLWSHFQNSWSMCSHCYPWLKIKSQEIITLIGSFQRYFLKRGTPSREKQGTYKKMCAYTKDLENVFCYRTVSWFLSPTWLESELFLPTLPSLQDKSTNMSTLPQTCSCQRRITHWNFRKLIGRQQPHGNMQIIEIG